MMGNPPSRCARQRNVGFAHSLQDRRVGTQGRRIDLTFMSLLRWLLIIIGFSYLGDSRPPGRIRVYVPGKDQTKMARRISR